jgi:hypothetical protein
MRLNFWQQWRDRHARAVLERWRRAQGKKRPPRRLGLERLEDRTVPSTIIWTNRGESSGGASDNFDAVFGAQANTARQVVDTAINEWQTVISNFNQVNHPDPDNHSLDNNYIAVSITMNTTAGSTGGNTSVLSRDANGKPTAAAITLGRTSDGTNAWYLNPTLFSSAFLGTPANAFTTYAQAGSPALGQIDLLGPITHELGHAVGFSSNSVVNARCTDTGVVDQTSVPATGPTRGDYYLFTGTGGFTALLTSFNSTADGTGQDTKGGEHFAAAGASATVGGTTYSGADDLMDVYYSSAGGERRIVSREDAFVLRDAYGYTVNDPAAVLGTFYAVLDETGTLTVRGRLDAPSTDIVSLNTRLSFVGGSLHPFITTSVDLGTPVQGTGYLLPYTAAFDDFTSVVKQINVQTGTQNSYIEIVSAIANAPISAAESGPCTLTVGYGGSAYLVTAPVTITNLGLIRNEVQVLDGADTAARTVTLDTVSLGGVSYGRVSDGGGPVLFRNFDTSPLDLDISSGPTAVNVLDTGAPTIIENVGGSDTVSVQRTTGPLDIAPNGGNTTITVGPNLSNIQGAITLSPTAGSFVTLDLNDTATTAPRELDIVTNGINTALQASGAALIQTQAGVQGVAHFQWEGGSGGNTVHVHGIPSGRSDFALGAGNNSLYLSSSATGNRISNVGMVRISGPGSIFLNDGDETNDQTYVVRSFMFGPEYLSTQGTSVYPGPSSLVFLTGGSGNNTLDSTPFGNTFRISGRNAGSVTSALGTVNFTGTQNLLGSGNDTFLFADGASVDGNISNPGGDTNTLDYSAYTTPVAVDLSAGTATGVGGSVSNIQILRGGQGDDSLTGNGTGTTTFLASPSNDTVSGAGGTNTLVGTSADSTWSVSAQNSGTLTFTGGTTTFSGVQNLTGGSGADDFVFADGTGVNGNVNGGGGADTLDLSAYSTPVAVDLSAGTATGVGGSVANIQSFVGSAAGGSTLLGPIFATTWHLSGTDAGTVNGVNFSNFSNLTGGLGGSTFVLADGAGVDGALTGGGTNTLDESAYRTPVTVDLTADTATGVGGFANIKTFVGSAAGGNTLNGPNQGPGGLVDWALTGHNAGSVNTGIQGGMFNFSAFQDLAGGAGINNLFIIATAGLVDGTLTGGAGGTNSLSYFGGFIGNVVVDFQTGTATGVGGAVANIQNVKGTSTPGFYNILVGNGGNILNGDGDPSLLIAGGSASTLIGGGAGTDVLIAGTTDYDTNLAALQDIMSVWINNSYANAVARLVDDPTYAFSLNAATVHSNGGGNVLTGKPGGSTALDLYFANLDAGDTIDAGPGDRVVGIS